MTLAPDAIFRTVLKGIPSTKGKRDGRKPVPNHTPFKSLRNNVSFVCPSLTDAVIVSEIEGREREKKKKKRTSLLQELDEPNHFEHRVIFSHVDRNN